MKKILIKLGLIAAVLASPSLYHFQAHAQEATTEGREHGGHGRAADRERSREAEQERLEEEQARRDEILRKERGDLEQTNDRGPLQDRLEPKDEEPVQDDAEIEQKDLEAGSAAQFPNGTTGYSTTGGGCTLGGPVASGESLVTTLIWGLPFLAPMLRRKKVAK